MARAFSLIEMMVVVLILGILAAAVSLSLAAPRRKARWEDLRGRIGEVDAAARQYAVRHGKSVQLVFDLSGQQLLATTGSEIKDVASGCPMPDGFRLAEVRLADARIDRNSCAIFCSDRGYSPTYGLVLEGDVGRKWLIVAGLSGQVSELKDEQTADKVFSALARHDAH